MGRYMRGRIGLASGAPGLNDVAEKTHFLSIFIPESGSPVFLFWTAQEDYDLMIILYPES